jgi:hypothetical protein
MVKVQLLIQYNNIFLFFTLVTQTRPLSLELKAVEVGLPLQVSWGATNVEGNAVALSTTFTCVQTGVQLQLFAKVKGIYSSAELFFVAVYRCTKYHILIKIVNWFDPLHPTWAPLTSRKASNFFGYYTWMCAQTQRIPLTVWGAHPLCFVKVATTMPALPVFMQVRKMVGAECDLSFGLDVANNGTMILGAADPDLHIGGLSPGVAVEADDMIPDTRLIAGHHRLDTVLPTPTHVLDVAVQSREDFFGSQVALQQNLTENEVDPLSYVADLIYHSTEIVLETCEVQLEAIATNPAALGAVYVLIAQDDILCHTLFSTVLPHAADAFLHCVGAMNARELSQVPGYWALKVVELGASRLLLQAVATLSSIELAAKGGDWAISTVRAGASEALCAAAATMSTEELAAKRGYWPEAARRAGVDFAVAVNTLTPEALANKSGEYAIAAVQAGAIEAVCAAAATMTPEELAEKGGRWVTAVRRAFRNSASSQQIGQRSESRLAVMTMLSAVQAQQDIALNAMQVLLAMPAEGGSSSALERHASSTAEAARAATVTPAKEKKPKKKKLTAEEKQELLDALRHRYNKLLEADEDDTAVESSSALVDDVKSWLPLQTLKTSKSQNEMRIHLDIGWATWDGVMNQNGGGTAENRSTAVKALWAAMASSA